MSYKTQDGLSEEDIKRIINNEVLEKWLKDKVKEAYKEEKEREIKEIIKEAERRDNENRPYC
tara:strand:+ start:885 stop:1070 length:186 start_codon:yes stop_codon:yes gene_type:complete